jgi:hypothetical protein
MIYYRIEPLSKGYRLSIWEPAPQSNVRGQPFYFKLNFTTSNLLESMKILNLIPGKKVNRKVNKYRQKGIKLTA